MNTFKIALEDKAAFLNRMEKAGVPLDTDQAVDNKLEGYFEVTITDPKQLEAVKTILKQSPKINTIKEMENQKKKLTKSELKEMIRQELASVKESSVNENVLTDPNFIGGVAALLGIGGAFAAGIIKDLRSAKTPEEKKKVLDSIAGNIRTKMSGDE
jgi:hypothetical protein